MDKNYCKENFAGGLSVSMKEMSETERPYEKSFKYGVEVLTDAELLAVILRTGSRKANALSTAYRILDAHPVHKGIVGLNYLTVSELEEISGVGKVKAIQMKCLAEISRRMARASFKPFCRSSPHRALRIISWRTQDISKRNTCISSCLMRSISS